MFNDDIQGTAATVLAGLYGAMKVGWHFKNALDDTFLFDQVRGQESSSLKDQTIVVAGAGSAGSGVLLTIR